MSAGLILPRVADAEVYVRCLSGACAVSRAGGEVVVVGSQECTPIISLDLVGLAPGAVAAVSCTSDSIVCDPNVGADVVPVHVATLAAPTDEFLVVDGTRLAVEGGLGCVETETSTSDALRAVAGRLATSESRYGSGPLPGLGTGEWPPDGARVSSGVVPFVSGSSEPGTLSVLDVSGVGRFLPLACDVPPDDWCGATVSLEAGVYRWEITTGTTLEVPADTEGLRVLYVLSPPELAAWHDAAATRCDTSSSVDMTAVLECVSAAGGDDRR